MKPMNTIVTVLMLAGSLYVFSCSLRGPSKVGVPITGDRWQVTITKAHQEYELSSDKESFNKTIYRPKPDLAFVVVDVTLLNIDPTRKTEFSSEDAAIVAKDGKTIDAEGMGRMGITGTDMDYCAGCKMKLSATSAKLSIGLVFVVKENTLDQDFKLKLPGMPLIPFSVEQKSKPASTSAR